MHDNKLGQTLWAGVSIIALATANTPLAIHLAVGTMATVTLASAVQAATLTNWQFNPGTQQLEIVVPEGTTPRYFLLAQPTRIVLDLPNTQIGAVPLEQGYSGAVRQIRIAQFQPNVTRIVIELSPGVALAPGQVELQRAAANGGTSSANGSGDRWILRPLLANDTSTTAAVPPPQAAEPRVPLIESAAAPPSAVADAPTTPSVTTNLPPLEPNAIEIPVTQDEAAVPNDASAEETTANRDTAGAIAAPSTPRAAEETGVNEAVRESSQESRENQATAATPPAAQTSTTLPPATFSSDRPATISVPPLTGSSDRAAALPPANQPANPSGQVSVPPLQTTPRPSPTQQSAAAPAAPASNPPQTAIEFGQPLPNQSPSTSQPTEPTAPAVVSTPTTVAVAPTANILIPSGVVLSLRYPGEAALALSNDEARQEVLVLEQSIVDQAGAVIVPRGSEVLGRFETGQEGSKFIAQALSLGSRNVLLQAESDVLQGDRRVSNNNVLLNSALGAIAGTLLGGVGVGLVGGAAAGATTYLAAPQPAVIQPNQIVQIRVIEPLARQQ